MSVKGFFITGTGTGVGKTLVTACLLRGLRGRGINAAPMKPVQTGVGDGGLFDLDVHLAAAEMKVDEETRRHMSPLRFMKAASPHLAARLENKRIEIAELLPHKEWLEQHYDCVLAEGAGGLLVPLNDNATMLDLARAFGYPIVVVINNALGAINHSLLTIQAIRHAGLPLAGVIFTESTLAEDPEINEDNINTILVMGGIVCLGRLPYQSELDLEHLVSMIQLEKLLIADYTDSTVIKIS